MLQIYLAEKKSPIRVKDVGGNNRVVQNPQRWGFQDGTLVGSRLLLLVGLIGKIFAINKLFCVKMIPFYMLEFCGLKHQGGWGGQVRSEQGPEMTKTSK